MVRCSSTASIRRVPIRIANLALLPIYFIFCCEGKDQVVNLHYILSRAQVKARPSVLWCYKKELGFSTHKKKVFGQKALLRKVISFFF